MCITTQMRPDFQLSGTENETDVPGAASQLESWKMEVNRRGREDVWIMVPCRLIGDVGRYVEVCEELSKSI